MKKAAFILFIFNCILLCVSWIMVLYAYPRLPQKIPLWLNFFGQPMILSEKSNLFFIYILIQTLFFFFFLLITGKAASSMASWKAEIFKEVAYLSLIFFNLIFIHVQRSLILMAHDIVKGVDKFYFYTLFGFILIMIPYYRMRKKMFLRKMMLQKKGNDFRDS